MNVWASFIFRYLLLGLLGTALIILLVPMYQESSLTVEDLTVMIPEKIRTVMPDRVSPPAAAPDTVAPAAAAPPRRTTPRVTPAPAARASRPPPSTDVSGARWGIVTMARTSYYSSKGKFMGHLPPGSLVDIVDIKRNNDDWLALCKSPENPAGATVLVSAGHLEIYDGRVTALDRKLKALYVQRAQLKVEIETRRREARTAVRADNPHARIYASARKAHRAYWDKVEDLTAKRDASTGEAQMRYSNELRTMKGDDIRLGQAYESARDQYQAWNAAHPRPATDDEQTTRLVVELTRIEGRLNGQTTLN